MAHLEPKSIRDSSISTIQRSAVSSWPRLPTTTFAQEFPKVTATNFALWTPKARFWNMVWPISECLISLARFLRGNCDNRFLSGCAENRAANKNSWLALKFDTPRADQGANVKLTRRNKERAIKNERSRGCRLSNFRRSAKFWLGKECATHIYRRIKSRSLQSR